MKVEAKQSPEKHQLERTPAFDAEEKSNEEKESRQEKITSTADTSVKKSATAAKSPAERLKAAPPLPYKG